MIRSKRQFRSSISLADILLILLSFLAILSGCSSRMPFFPEPPAGKESWWIVINKYCGPDREQEAEKVYSILKNISSLDASKVKKIREGDCIIVGYGSYVDYDSPDARQDLKKIHSIALDGGIKAFWMAHLEAIPEPAPEVNPEYLLENAKGYWTLEIARFTGPGRKARAVEYLLQLRKESLPAYIHHGQVQSVVCLGAFPPEAVKADRKYIGAVKILDPQLKELKKSFPHIQINGQYVKFRPTWAKRSVYRSTEIRKISSILTGTIW